MKDYLDDEVDEKVAPGLNPKKEKEEAEKRRRLGGVFMRNLEDKYEDILKENNEKEAAEKRRRFAEQPNFLEMNKLGQE